MNPHFGPETMAFGQRMMDGSAPFAGLGIVALIGVLLLAVVVIALVVWAVVHAPRTSGDARHAGLTAAPPAQDTALAIARERLARGEIDPEQYGAIVAALGP